MKPSWHQIVIIGIILASMPATAATTSDDALVKQFSRGIATSETAVACGLRTLDWRKSVFLGYIASARIAVMAEHPGASDNKINARAMNIFKAAKMDAAFQAKFAAPSQAVCDTLKTSRDMEEMDAAAKIGLLFGAANE